MTFGRDHDWNNRLGESDRKYPESNTRGLPQGYSRPGQEQFPINQRNASPDRYSAPYPERNEYRSSPHRYGTAEGSPSRYGRQDDAFAEDPVVQYGAYRN